jgi:hypothetical protein
MNSEIGKEAEKKIREWLDRPELGFCFDRIPDQMTGLEGSENPCDFLLFKSPEFYYIESKATYEDRFDFNMIRKHQYQTLVDKSKIDHVHGVVVVLFASYKRAFWIPIQSIKTLSDSGIKSINITKISKWNFDYTEIITVPNNRKKLLDYSEENYGVMFK